jgi:hypothetical protein
MKSLQIPLLLLIVLVAENLSANDYGTNRDNQSWNTLRITHPIDEKWSVSLQNEARFTEDMTNLDEYVVKLYAHHNFSEKFGLSFGYKHINRPSEFNETDPWVELVFLRLRNKWHLSHQVRFASTWMKKESGRCPDSNRYGLMPGLVITSAGLRGSKLVISTGLSGAAIKQILATMFYM